MEITLIEIVKSEPLESNMSLAFGLNHFVIQIINSRKYLDLLAYGRQSKMNDIHTSENYTISRLLEPCRL